MKVENRIPELIQVLNRINSAQHRREATREPARRMMESSSILLRRFAPHGQVEPGWSTPHGSTEHSRPSMRQHGTTLEMGWRNRMENFGAPGGTGFVIENVAPHVLHVIYGTRRHFIPASPRLAFWWGDYSSSGDAGWGPYQGDPQGPFVFDVGVNHPGARPNNFVERAVNASRPRMRALTRDAASVAMRPLNQFFGRS